MKKNFPGFKVIIGSGLLIAGLFMVAKTYRFASHATKTTGTIIKMDDTDECLVPVFVFTNEAGTEYRCRSRYGCNLYHFKPGESVSVVYDAAVPTHAEINSFMILWGGPVLVEWAGWGLDLSTDTQAEA